MMPLSHADAFEVLCLQAADNGRGDILFGESLPRARSAVRPFMLGEKFPSVYFEFPLIGAPFLDVTVLYSKLAPGQRVDSEAAAGTDAMLAWFADACQPYDEVCCGFELDTKHAELPQAAVHFQPRTHVELVEPFCAAVGESDRAALYLDLAARMPEGWPLSFFGMFRGRPDAPLRVCGYHGERQKAAYRDSRAYIAGAFDRIGFGAYNDDMLAQISNLMAVAPGGTDFQFDVYADGSLSSTFSIDVQFAIEQPGAVMASFEDGPAAQVMEYLQRLGAADDRWKLGAQTAFARSIPMENDDGTTGGYAFTIMPQWVKVRWTDGQIQPSKLYLLGGAGFLEDSVKDRFARRLGMKKARLRRGD